MTTLLIDGDVFAYKAAMSCQKAHRWDDDIISTHVDLNEAKDALDGILWKLKNDLEADDIIVALTDRGSEFRRVLWPSYKGNRTGPKPLALSALNDHYVDAYRTYIRPTLEADDILGILATHKSLVKGRKIIVTTDKDLSQIPGLHFNPDKDEDVRTIDEEDGNFMFLMQTLTGDTTDNYPGCPGCGPVKATKALDDDPSWGTVVKQYIKAGLTEEDALVQARLAKILHSSDYDFKKKEVILWSPK